MKRPLDRLKESVHTGNLWLYILRLLAKKSYYGFELRSAVEKRFGFWVGTVTSYKVLYLMEHDGYVTSLKNGREIYYTITSKGRTELNAGNKFLKTA